MVRAAASRFVSSLAVMAPRDAARLSSDVLPHMSGQVVQRAHQTCICRPREIRLVLKKAEAQEERRNTPRAAA
jgi:hypothetical protein